MTAPTIDRNFAYKSLLVDLFPAGKAGRSKITPELTELLDEAIQAVCEGRDMGVRDVELFRFRKGLDTGKIETQEATGKRFEVQRQAVFQIEHRILGDLRKHPSLTQVKQALESAGGEAAV